VTKRAVSVSLGSNTRDKRVTVYLLGQEITLERIGTDGDTERATRLFQVLDGRVDALGWEVLTWTSRATGATTRSTALRSSSPAGARPRSSTAAVSR
jgi:hypothetical protein